jgi:hypothetical protein
MTAALLTGIGTLAILGTALVAAGLAWRQIKLAERERKVDRVLDLHKEFARGSIGVGRERFATLMWRAGDMAFNRDWQGRGLCWQPSWESIFSESPGLEPRLNQRRFLGEYPPNFGIPDLPGSSPLSDLRQVLWCVSRIESARKKDLLNDSLLISSLGWEVVWWRLLCERLYGDRLHGGGIIEPLDRLSKWIQDQYDSSGKCKFMKGRDYPPAQDFPRAQIDYPSRECELKAKFGMLAGGRSQILVHTNGSPANSGTERAHHGGRLHLPSWLVVSSAHLDNVGRDNGGGSG